MRLEIRSARTTLNPTRQEVMPRRAARFFRFSLSLSLSLSLFLSFSFLSPSSALPSYLLTFLPTFYLPTTHTLFVTSLSATMFSLRTAQPVQVCLAFYYFPFQSSIKDTPPLPIDISCIIFFSSPNSSLVLPPQFPHTFCGNNCLFAFFYFYYILSIFKIYVAYLMMRFTSLCSVALRPLLSRAPPSQQDVCTELRIAFTTGFLANPLVFSFRQCPVRHFQAYQVWRQIHRYPHSRYLPPC